MISPPSQKQDTILAELLQIHKEHIVGYHEHDSLLDHKEEELTEEERKAAWAEYEAEKKGLTMRFNIPTGTNLPLSLSALRLLIFLLIWEPCQQ